MIFTQNLTYDTGRFLCLARGSETKAIHSEKHPPVDRFEAVPDIRKRPGHDNRHGVIDIRTLHLLVNVDLLYPACIYFIFHILSLLFCIIFQIIR